MTVMEHLNVLMVRTQESPLVIITILIMANIIIESRLKILHAALANPTGSVRLLKKFSKSENQRDKW